jgi:hypothetical protein
LEQVWKFNVGTGFNAPPMTFETGGNGRPTWRTTAPGGRTLFGRWFPGALRIRSRVLRRLPGRALGFLARRFLLFGVQFLGHRQRPHLGIVPHASSSCGGSARPNEQPSDKAL